MLIEGSHGTTTTTTINPEYTYSNQQDIYNSVAGVYGLHNNVKFVKDPEKLLHQYEHLIYSVAKQYTHQFKTEQDRKDLVAHIKSTFISLVIEYDPFSGVDFPGYIKAALNIRIRYSYVQVQLKKRYYESPMKANDLTEEEMVDYIAFKNNNAEYNKNGAIANINSDGLIDDSLIDFFETLNKEVKLDTLDYYILYSFFQGVYGVSQIVRAISSIDDSFSKYAIQAEVKEVKKLLAKHYEGARAFAPKKSTHYKLARQEFLTKVKTKHQLTHLETLIAVELFDHHDTLEEVWPPMHRHGYSHKEVVKAFDHVTELLANQFPEGFGFDLEN